MRGRTAIVIVPLLLLVGCATFTPDGGFDRVADLTKERTGQNARWHRTAAEEDAARDLVAKLLTEPLTFDSVVEIALLNNPGLQATFEQLRIGEADLVRAGRLRNPTFSFSRQKGGGHLEIERALVLDLLSIATLPLTYGIEQQRFTQTQLEVASQASAVAAEARHAWIGAVTAQQLARYYEQVKEAADASAELARRMAEVGNFSALARMREQAFYADATTQLARARHQATAERERLVRALGLAGSGTHFTLPDRLPDLPKTPLTLTDAERTAIETRLDVQIAKRNTELLAQSLGLTKTTGFLNVLHVGYGNTSESDEHRRNGFEIELELPIFDFGTTRLARAEGQYRQALNRTAEVAIAARSQVREAYSAFRTTLDIAMHYRDEVVPLRKRISEEQLLRYNGMLISVFELLSDARDQVASVTAAMEAARDFWVAETNLRTVMTTGTPGAASVIRPATAPAAGGGAGH